MLLFCPLGLGSKLEGALADLHQSIGEVSSSGGTLEWILSYLLLWEKSVSPSWGGGRNLGLVKDNEICVTVMYTLTFNIT